MLMLLADWLQQFEPSFRVFSYLTLRAILSTLTALLIAVLIGPCKLAKRCVMTALNPIWPNQARLLWAAY